MGLTDDPARGRAPDRCVRTAGARRSPPLADRPGILPDVTAAVRRDAARRARSTWRRRPAATGGQGRAHEPGRIGQGPHRAAHDRGRRAGRAPPAGRRDHRADLAATPASGWRRRPRSRAIGASSSWPTSSRRRSGPCCVPTAPRSWSARPTSTRTTSARTTGSRDRLARETPGAWKPDQYSNPANPSAHYQTHRAGDLGGDGGRITHFVVGVGTGGTISGVGKLPEGAEPDDGGSSGPTRPVSVYSGDRRTPT